MWWVIGIVVFIGVGLVCLLWAAFVVGARDDEAMARWYDDQLKRGRAFDGHEETENDGA